MFIRRRHVSATSAVWGVERGKALRLSLSPRPQPPAPDACRVRCHVTRVASCTLAVNGGGVRLVVAAKCFVAATTGNASTPLSCCMLARPLERGAWPPLYNVCTSAESAARGSATIFYLHKSSTDAVLYSLPQYIYSSHSASARVTMPLPDPKIPRNSCSMCPVCSSLDYVPRVCSRALKESRPSNASGRRACRHHPNTQHLRCATWQAQAV